VYKFDIFARQMMLLEVMFKPQRVRIWEGSFDVEEED
jgi:hypothetical protein